MFALLWVVPAFPLAAFAVLSLYGARLSRRAVAAVGVGSVGLSALIAVLVSVSFISFPPPEHASTSTLWSWIAVSGFRATIGFRLDALSLVMTLVVTVVGFLIHVYSAEFMQDEAGYSRFFAYMNLFVGSMVTLVLADNLALLYLGWEGVGLCSYLLIGFWYRDPANGAAARKAFIVTRIGDSAMAVGLFLLYTRLGTLDIQELARRAARDFPVGSAPATLAASLLLGGAVGKSAQLPLQTWLPDAMAGPTPVSALIHAATMVTAGVYLIARMHGLFELAPGVQLAVAVIGAVTLLVAGFSALAQRDLKRILAYSTISQIGYMFLALGVGAWTAAIFHLATHAFFKALLFLAAGVVIQAMHEEHDIYAMGGLRKQVPVAFWTFLIGSASLAAFPLVTAGFYSKDAILWAAFGSSRGGHVLWAAGLVGAFLTALYVFRAVFVVFFGEARREVRERPGMFVRAPLVCLATLSVIAGFVQMPRTLGPVSVFSNFLATALPGPGEALGGIGQQAILQAVAGCTSLLGIYVAYLYFHRAPERARALASDPMGRAVQRFFFSGFRVDAIYEMVFVRPFVWFASTNRSDVIDRLYAALARVSAMLHRLLGLTETGRVRWYAAVVAAGTAVLLLMLVLS